MWIIEKSKFSKVIVIVAAAVCCVRESAITAQPLLKVEFHKFESQLVYNQWSLRTVGLEDISVSQFAIPLSFDVYWGSRGSFKVRSTWASSSFRTGGLSYTMNSFSDLKLEGSYVLGDHFGLLTLGLNVPSGNSRLTQNEFIVTTALAEDALAFPLSLYGVSPEGNIGLTFAVGSESIMFGFGGSYFIRGKFRLFQATESKLHLGNEVTGSFGLDVELPYVDLSLDSYLTFRERVKLADFEIFDPGKKLVLSLASGIQHPPLLPISLNAWFVRRWQFGGDLLGLPDNAPFDEIIGQNFVENADQLQFGSKLRYQPTIVSSVLGLFEFRHFGKTDNGYNSARLLGVGIGFEVDGIRLGIVDWLTTNITVKHLWGKLNSLGKEFRLSGFVISGIVSCSF